MLPHHVFSGADLLYHPPPFLGGGGGGGQLIRIILVAEPVSLGRSASNSISYNMLDKFP